MANVQLKQVVKKYGSVEVVHGIDLDINDNEFIVLVGPSGCGKSTVLRMVAGLEEISGGEIRISDRVVNQVSPKDRNVAMVFQNYALYPHMTVRENMGFSLKMRKRSKDDIAEKVLETARILELEPYLDRKPSELSGGQRQRVAMGRAMVRKPDVFFLTNRCPISTPSCAPRCAWNCARCRCGLPRRPSMSPMTRSRP